MVRRAELDIVITGDETDLRRSVNRSEDALERVGRAATRAGAVTERTFRRGGGMSRGIQNAAFQFGDLATQIGAGTSASIALGQQLPQLLGGFGVLGAVMGAVVAIAVPLTRALSNMNVEGGNLVSIFGVLEPLALRIADGFGAIRDIGIQMADLIINNLDRILITAGGLATFMAGRWVASFVAARIATMSLAGSLAFLRTALIRTGIGAAVVAAGELIYQFTRLTSAVGGVGKAIGLVGGVFAEFGQRVRNGIFYMGELWDGLAMIIQGGMLSALGAVQDAIVNTINKLLMGVNAIKGALRSLGAEGIAGGDIPLLQGGGLGAAGANMQAGGRVLVQGASSDLGALLTKPLESVQKIRDTLASIKDDRIDLPSLLGVGGEDGEGGAGGGGKSAAEKLDEELSAQEERIKTHFDRIKALTEGGLSDKLGAWGDYFSNLVSLTGTNNKKLLAIGKAFSAAQSLVDAWSAYTQVLRDPAFIGRPWARAAAAAQVLAAGIGAVNAIKSVGEGGTGPTSASGRGAPQNAGQIAAGPEQPETRSVNINFRGAGLLPTETVIGLLEQINEVAGEGLVIRSNR